MCAQRENFSIDSIIVNRQPIFLLSDDFGPTMMIQMTDPCSENAMPAASIESILTLLAGKDDVPPNCPFVRIFLSEHVNLGECYVSSNSVPVESPAIREL